MCNLLTNFFFFFNDTATPEIYTLPLHAALPISRSANDDRQRDFRVLVRQLQAEFPRLMVFDPMPLFCDALRRSEEHTSELQSQSNLVCRLLLEKKTTLTIVYH